MPAPKRRQRLQRPAVARRALRLRDGSVLRVAVYSPRRSGRDSATRVVLGAEARDVFGIDSVQSLSLAFVYVGQTLERLRSQVRKEDRHLCDGFPLLVPTVPEDLRAKVLALIDREARRFLRAHERRAQVRGR